MDINTNIIYFIWINQQKRIYQLSRKLRLDSETNKLLMPFFFTQLKFSFSCNVVTIVTMITCNIIIGTVAITHFQYESTVGMDYKNQKNQDHFKAEEDFKARNVAGKTGLTVYSIVMVVITSDVLLNAALVLISRYLFQVRQKRPFISSACQFLNKKEMPYLAPKVFWVLNM